MTRHLRASSALAAALAVTLAPVAPAFAQHLHAPPPPPAPAAHAAGPLKLAQGQWPQAVTNVPVDPDTLFGALPNGMRYAIRKQSIPPGQGALRLWVDAGSMDETDPEQGLAHFLEHMAFNGSKSVPEGDMIKILERLGLSFGADTNASTNFGQTIYQLDLPKTNDETVDTSLMLLREAAGNLTISQTSVDRERGVVLSEERARDTPAYRVYKQRLAFLLPGQRLPTRYPIGQVDILKSAQASTIADFYHAWYRPERTVLVAVGDFDPKAVEAKIRAKFSDWQATAPIGSTPDRGRVAPRHAEARLVVDTGVPLSLQIAWVRPPDLAADTLAKRRQDLVQQLGVNVLNRRFSALGRSATPPFLGAGAAKSDMEKSAELSVVAANAAPGQWKPALDAIEQEQRRIVRYGVRQDEVDREVEEVRAVLKAQAAGAATRRQADLANEIVGSLDDQEVVTNPAQDLALFEADVKGLTAAEVSGALKGVFAGAGPLIFVSSPQPIEGGEAAILAAFNASQKVAVTAPAATAQIAWPYENFGAPGKVAESREVADLGTTFIRFANGVRLTVKPTKFRDDEVLVRVNIGHGLEDLPRDRQSTTWASGAYIEGGLKRISNEDMERVLATKLYGARFGVSDEAFTFTGGTRTGDLPTQMQVLAAYLAEPGWRPQAFTRLQNSGKTIHDQFEATDSGVLARDLGGLLHSGDRRWTFPSREEIAGGKLSDLEAQIQPELDSGPVEVVIVGDVTVQQATDVVARTFAALPARAPVPPPPATQMQTAFPAGSPTPVLRTHKGRADQSIGYIAWPTADFWADPQRARNTAVLGEVIRTRLTEQLREAEGATYSPSVTYTHSQIWTNYGYLAANVEVPPDKLPVFFSDVQKIVDDLKTKPVSDDELARAKQPRVETIQRAQVTNQYWLSELSGAQADPRRLDAVRQAVPGTQAVTAADVERAAQTFLKDDKAFRLIVKPEAK
jgi:zinc protease